jgi:hypothetical protein
VSSRGSSLKHLFISFLCLEYHKAVSESKYKERKKERKSLRTKFLRSISETDIVLYLRLWAISNRNEESFDFEEFGSTLSQTQLRLTAQLYAV